MVSPVLTEDLARQVSMPLSGPESELRASCLVRHTVSERAPHASAHPCGRAPATQHGLPQRRHPRRHADLLTVRPVHPAPRRRTASRHRLGKLIARKTHRGRAGLTPHRPDRCGSQYVRSETPESDFTNRFSVSRAVRVGLERDCRTSVLGLCVLACAGHYTEGSARSRRSTHGTARLE